jgi:hypothetical protein
MELIIDSESDSNSELLKNAKEAEREQQAFLEITSVEQTYQGAKLNRESTSSTTIKDKS